MIPTSTLITIIYFSCNFILLLALGIHVKLTGEHSSIKSQSYWKDVWNQRKIYTSIIVHVYDTATDFGVVYYWYTLMLDEQGGKDYTSVDMTVFFWTGITFLVVYRVVAFIAISFIICTEDKNSGFRWWHLILALLDLYIFVTVYDSFKEAQDVIADNITARKEKKAQKSVETAPGGVSASTKTQKMKIKEVQLNDIQIVVQMGESILESLPQIMLQSVFVIRSANDKALEGGNLWMILLSTVASLLSIANKFIYFDKDEVKDKAETLKPQKKCGDCIQYFYVVRVLWRVCSIVSNFVIYVLMWTVLGGAWLPIWCGFTFIAWFVVYQCVKSPNWAITIVLQRMMYSFIALGGQYVDDNFYFEHIAKYILNAIGLGIIAVFASIEFKCGICADSSTRQFENKNIRIKAYFIMGCCALFGEMILYVVATTNDVFRYENRWKK
eukprot:519760_1